MKIATIHIPIHKGCAFYCAGKSFTKLIAWELQGGYLQKIMEKFSPTFFNQILGVDFGNSRYADQIRMEHPYFGL